MTLRKKKKPDIRGVGEKTKTKTIKENNLPEQEVEGEDVTFLSSKFLRRWKDNLKDF